MAKAFAGATASAAVQHEIEDVFIGVLTPGAVANKSLNEDPEAEDQKHADARTQ